MLIVEVADARDGRQILTHQLAEDARSRPVEDADALGTDLDSVVDEIGYGLEGFVAAHTTYVDLLFEVETLLVHLVGRLLAEECGLLSLPLQLVAADALEAVELDGALDHAEGDSRLIPRYFDNLTCRGLTLEAHRVARLERLVFGSRFREHSLLLLTGSTVAKLLHLAGDGVVVVRFVVDG